MHNVEAQDFLAIVSVTSVSITLMEIFIKLWRMIYYNKLNYLKEKIQNISGLPSFIPRLIKM